MTAQTIAKFREQLWNSLKRTESATSSLREQVRLSADGGNLSTVPMHLADLGAEAYTQELSATLLETEEQEHTETLAAIDRIDSGNYGRCEECGIDIPEERLEVLPSTRYCTRCSATASQTHVANLNDGRPRDWRDTLAGQDALAEPNLSSLDQAAFSNEPMRQRNELADIHAIGTPGGGTAVGGLAGTNIGHGDPSEADLEEAAGTGSYDVEIDEDDDELDTYSGPTGGAVGGTPAGKRATGGHHHS